MAMGQNSVPPVNIKMGGAPTNQNGIPLVLTHSLKCGSGDGVPLACRKEQLWSPKPMRFRRVSF